MVPGSLDDMRRWLQKQGKRVGRLIGSGGGGGAGWSASQARPAVVEERCHSRWCTGTHPTLQRPHEKDVNISQRRDTAKIDVSFEMVKQSTEYCRIYGVVFSRHRNAGFPTENASSTSKHNDGTCLRKTVGGYFKRKTRHRQEKNAAPMYDAAVTL